MNINFFEEQLIDIESEISAVKSVVKLQENFPEEARKRFNRVLDSLLGLLAEESFFPRNLKEPWHAALCIVKISSVESKLRKLRLRILLTIQPPYFVKKLKDVILPSLGRRIGVLQKEMCSLGRLPFEVGKVRDHFLQWVEKDLQLETESTMPAQKEYFHVLGNELDLDGLKSIDTGKYEGNCEINSLVSWGNVLQSFMAEGPHQDRAVGQFLLDIIEKSKQMSLKATFALDLPQMRREGPESLVEYCGDFLQTKLTPITATPRFMDKYTLDQKDSIPAKVLINEMSWDAIDTIDQMREGDSRLFLMGTVDHCIAIEISCVEFEKGVSDKYNYKIFNTGPDVDRFHFIKVEGAESYACPLLFTDLSRTVFTYQFFEHLVNLSLQGKSVDAFYHLHKRVLLGMGGGRCHYDTTYWYKLQKFGICSYSVVEAWICSHLAVEQQKRFAFHKAQFSLARQENVVALMQAGCQKDEWRVVLKRKAAICKRRTLKTKKLSCLENQLLLELGKIYRDKLRATIELIK